MNTKVQSDETEVYTFEPTGGDPTDRTDRTDHERPLSVPFTLDLPFQTSKIKSQIDVTWTTVFNPVLK